jgi:hypothetical protein
MRKYAMRVVEIWGANEVHPNLVNSTFTANYCHAVMDMNLLSTKGCTASQIWVDGGLNPVC